MKRAPGLAMTLAILRSVGVAAARKASSATPSYRFASSTRLRATISPRMPSATSGLDELAECTNRGSGPNCLPRVICTFTQVRGLSGCHEQCRGVEDNEILLRPAALLREQRQKPLCNHQHVAVR